jgi:hypothetical protein
LHDRLGLEWHEDAGELKAFRDGREIAWAPQTGAQYAFLSCPVFEALLEGNRGGGKSDALVMDFAQHCGIGFGPDWRGMLFRQTYKQLEDIVAKTKKWFPKVFAGVTFNSTAMHWDWPTGERLYLSYMEREQDYWGYHGHAYPWVGWEELTTWPTDKCYKVMMSCCRSTKAGVYLERENPDTGKTELAWEPMPRKYRSTTNPYGVGHNWVKLRFGLPVPRHRLSGQVINDKAGDRVAIHCDLESNKVLLHAEPGYLDKVLMSAMNPSQAKAWAEGSWDIVAGGMFDDLWQPSTHVVPDLSPKSIPHEWRINKSYDHGQSHPFSVGWWAESNGEPIKVSGRTLGGVPGDLFRFAEWYGWNGQPNEGIRMTARDIAQGIVERETKMGILGRCKQGPADSSIFDDFEPGSSVAGEMRAKGVLWQPAQKGPGSRIQGWQAIRAMLKNAAQQPREEAGLFVCEGCEQFIRTVPVLPRLEKNLDDVDSDAEDHVGDEVRYRVRERIHAAKSRSF